MALGRAPGCDQVVQNLVVQRDHSLDGRLAEEAVLAIHEVVCDAGPARLVVARLERGRDGEGVADGAQVVLRDVLHLGKATLTRLQQ